MSSFLNPEQLLLWALLIPSLTVPLLALSRKFPNMRETVTLISSLALLGVIIQLWIAVADGARPELQIVEMFPGVPLIFRLEPLGMIFAGVAAVLWPINSIYSIGYMRANAESDQTRFFMFFAVAIACSMAIAFSGNLLTLFVFYEALTLSTYPLVTHKGNEAAKKGGRTYLGILFATSIGLFLPAVLWTWNAAGTLDFMPGGILDGKIGSGAVLLLLALFVFGVGKAAIMPVHRWLPAAMVAPTPVSALLHAVAVVKAGVFSIVKITVYIFGIDFLSEQPHISWFTYVACITILLASFIALRMGNLKRRLAYSTISQLSYIVLAVAILAPISATAAALHIVAHAFGKITLFFAAGSIYTAAHKTEINQLNGIGRRMPWTMAAFAVGTLSMVGLPPAAGFISKWYLLQGALQVDARVAIAVIVISTLLNAAYFVPIVYAAFFKADDGSMGTARVHEAPLPIVLALVLTATLVLLMFFFPGIPSQMATRIGVQP